MNDKINDINSPFPPFPRINHVALFLGMECNLSCLYCYNKDKQKSRMPHEILERVMEFILCQSGRHLSVGFMGGEPLIQWERTREIIERLEEKGRENSKKITFSIVTNGTLLSEEILNFLWNKRVGMTLSIDGTPEIHNQQRGLKGGGGSFYLLEKNLPLILKKPFSVHVRMTVSPQTIGNMFEGVKFIFGLGFQSLAIGLERDAQGWNEPQFTTLNREYKKIMDWYINQLREDRKIKLVDLDFGSVSLDFPYREKGMPCGAGMEGIAVSPEGLIYPCYRFVGMEGTEIGDVFYGFHKEKRRKYANYSRMEITECRQCAYNYRCHRCPWLSFIKTGNIYDPVSLNCREADIMLNLFKNFRDVMEKSDCQEYKNRKEVIKKTFFKG